MAFKRKDYQYKLAHKLCYMAGTIFLEDIDFRTMAKGFLGKHTVDAGFGQFSALARYPEIRKTETLDGFLWANLHSHRR